MSSSSRVSTVLYAGIFTASLMLLPGILDLTLMPRLAAIALFLLVALFLLRAEAQDLRLRPDPILLSYFAGVCVSLLSLFWALNRSEALPEIAKTLMTFLLFLFCCHALVTEPERFVTVLSKIAIVIFYILFLNGAWQLLQTSEEDNEWLYRIIGLNGHKNLFASFLFLLLFFLLRGATQLSGAWRQISRFCVLLCLLTVLLLRSKAVWLGLGVAAGTYTMLFLLRHLPGLKVGKWYLWLIVLMVGFNAFFLFALQPLTQKGIAWLNVGKGGAVMQNEGERLQLWDKTYHLVKQQPFGVGAGNWQVKFPDATLSGLWRAEDLNYTFQRPHNDFLWILAETGWIGLNLYLLFILSLLLLLARAVRRIAEWKNAALCLAFISGYLTISFFDFPKERIEHLMWSAALFAIGWNDVRSAVGSRQAKSRSVSGWWWLAFLSVGFILIVSGLRLSGEWHVRQLYAARQVGDATAILKNGKAARNIAYSLDPTSLPVDWYIGNACATLNDFQQAKTHFLKAFSQNPWNRNVLNDLGSAYSMTGNADSAKWMYRQASRISPRFDDPKLNLAAVYIAEQNYAAAKNCLDSMYHDSEQRTKYKQYVEEAMRMQ